VRAGARQVQGTLNGLGERCGNANLVAILPTLMLKMGYETGVKREDLKHLTHVSRIIDERLNRAPQRNAAYVGESAFAHKGGLHASAVEKNPETYEHIDPDLVGNTRHIVVSDQSGRSNVLARLADAGIPLGSQTVLLRGINDEVDTLKRLYHGLLMRRVKPYYLYQCDPITGSAHFRTPVEKGLEIIQGLRGHTTGYAVPTFVIDAPGGGGKIPLLPDYLQQLGSEVVLKNYRGDLYRYANAEPAEAIVPLEQWRAKAV